MKTLPALAAFVSTVKSAGLWTIPWLSPGPKACTYLLFWGWAWNWYGLPKVIIDMYFSSVPYINTMHTLWLYSLILLNHLLSVKRLITLQVLLYINMYNDCMILYVCNDIFRYCTFWFFFLSLLLISKQNIRI